MRFSLAVISLTYMTLAQQLQQSCNGHAEYCSQKFSSLSYTGAHDSPFVRLTYDNSLFGNQFYDVGTQLRSGIRMLQAQAHPSPITNTSASGIQLCHTSCALQGADFGPVEAYLTNVTTWLRENPNEVIAILWVNGEMSIQQWAQAYALSGLLQYTYQPPSDSGGILSVDDWPSLSALIDNSTRVVSFIDSGANFTAVPYILDEFSNIFETSFGVTDPAAFSCDLDRPSTSSIRPSEKMYLINHFLDFELGTTGITIPNVTYAAQTNSASECQSGSLSQQVINCTSVWSRRPNFLLVDFFDQGNGSSIAVAAQANDISYKQTLGFPGPFVVPGSITDQAVCDANETTLSIMDETSTRSSTSSRQQSSTTAVISSTATDSRSTDGTTSAQRTASTTRASNTPASSYPATNNAYALNANHIMPLLCIIWNSIY